MECEHDYRRSHTVEDYLVSRCAKCNATDLRHFGEMTDEEWEWVRQHLRDAADP